VELGNGYSATTTHSGLRPFRRNLTYYGVDVDQVIGARKNFGLRIFNSIMRQFEKGVFTPLPYSVFDAASVSEAFHLMQQSGHIGKLVVRPPRDGAARLMRKPFQVRAEGTHTITAPSHAFHLQTPQT